ncbi:MAG: hypothetical protein JSR80_00500 [Verrucomicrobia bacterium]|nr:hypothetical protein [Verrucomicrobiota bacterium]
MEQLQTITVRNQVGAVGLIAGTCIGAGILGLPVETAAVGFIPSLILYAICWFFMSWTGLIFVDIFDKARSCTSFISLARFSFGPVGVALTAVVYAGLFFTLMAVYMRGGGGLVALCLSPSPPLWIDTTAFVVLLTPLMLMGMRVIGSVNALLLCVMVAAYLLFVVVCFPCIDMQLLERAEWGNMGLTFPIILTAFGFQGGVPTLLKQLNYDKGAAKRAIVVGSLLAFAVYILWQALILGTIPYAGTTGLQAALANDQTAIAPLQTSVRSSWIYPLGTVFGLCALASSFLGVGISLVDFLAEGKSLRWRRVSYLGVIAIPYLLAIQNVPIFYPALRYGGGLGCLLLLVVLPTAVFQKSVQGHSKSGIYILWAFVSLATYYEIAHFLN